MSSLKKYVTVALILMLASRCEGTATGEGVIMTGPETQIVAPGEIAYFKCHARGDSVYWYVNGTDPYPEQPYEARGITFNYTEIPRPSSELEEHNNTIAIEARPSNNNTRIACTSSGWIYGQHAYREGHLIIAGSPLRPTVSLFQEHVINNIITYRLNWSKPFTWTGFPIFSYEVILYNISSGEPVTAIKHVNDSGPLSLTHHGISDGPACYLLNFSVAAINRVGRGEPASIQSGHPIVPGEIGDIETVVTFASNGTPHFWMSFSAPRICPGYQSGIYSIAIYDDKGSLSHKFGPTEYTQKVDDENTLVVEEVRSGLQYGRNFTVEVTSASIGITHSRTKAFDTIFGGDCSPQAESPQPNLCSCKSILQADPCPEPSSGWHTALIVGVTVGVTVLLFCGCLDLIVLVACRRRKKLNYRVADMPIVETDSVLALNKPKKAKPPNLKIQASNPIYEGSMYETPPGENLKSLLSPCSVPCTPLAESASRYVFDFPPKLPPPRKGSVSIPPKLETHDEVIPVIKESCNQHTDGEYMIMNGGQYKQDKVLNTTAAGDDTYATAGKCGREKEYVSVK